MRRRQIIDLPSTTGKALQPQWLSPAKMLEIKGGYPTYLHHASRMGHLARDQAKRDVKVTLPKLKFMGEV